MEIRKATDAGGKELTCKHYDGINFPPNVPGNVKHHLEAVKRLSHKDGDVMVVSFPKAGTHWTSEIIYMLTTEKAQYCTKKALVLDFDSAEKHEKMETPRVLVTHLLPKHLPQSFFEHKTKIIYVYRNPKDTAVSMHSFITRLHVEARKNYDGKWHDYIDIYWDGHELYSGWFQHIRTWIDFMKDNSEYPILFISFEDMKKDLRQSVQRLAEFLGAKQDKDFLDEVAKKCQFSAMKKEKNETMTFEKGLTYDGTNPFYRKGDVGDWKNHFTVAQNERFDEKMKENITGIDVSLQFTL